MPGTARADVVGSLLRPRYLQEARRAFGDASATLEDVRAAEDRAVLEAIALQEEAGVDVLSDGEARRTSWIASISVRGEPAYRAPLGGLSTLPVERPAWFSYWRGHEGRHAEVGLSGGWFVVTERLRAERDIVGDEYGFLRRHTSRRTKYTFPAPSYHRVFWNPEHSRAAYPTVDTFLAAVRDYIRRDVIERAIDLGCDYVQMDAPNYGQSYTDPEVREAMRAQGHDLDEELRADVDLDNSVFEGVEGVTRALHVCRGNGPGGVWSATGGYDRFADRMFPALTNVDTLLLEYDTPRAGDFTPLRHVAPHQTVVLGLLTTKEPALEDAAEIERRIYEAAQHVPLERLALSPQCGFASAGAGNPLTTEEQAAKLRRVVEVARRVWA
ncbi:MAG: cobalamin-independent methionine synthase II family protein [Candidatus Dormibacteraeota bacterium]|nr:cobalamin-independent methionine synthase II family protein [Candidatus Dormibacteraeota bacterium]